ncbi:hypothetical protein [Glycomyces paridis]|uniref:Uncharacterized protein n=1 Tax=Glycomyces paridis TaxID=2126555 RepID=A0A4S8PHW6_9ACTN|nr:hypothetical protein [Glycomyces paridis]THV27924.1 hypothetical protein E9998_13105 [Glycomyces paridis]
MTGPNNEYRHANTCEATGKRAYLTRKGARQNRRATNQRTGESASQLAVYRCEHCDLFHIGHLPSRLRAERATDGPQ